MQHRLASPLVRRLCTLASAGRCTKEELCLSLSSIGKLRWRASSDEQASQQASMHPNTTGRVAARVQLMLLSTEDRGGSSRSCGANSSAAGQQKDKHGASPTSSPFSPLECGMVAHGALALRHSMPHGETGGPNAATSSSSTRRSDAALANVFLHRIASFLASDDAAVRQQPLTHNAASDTSTLTHQVKSNHARGYRGTGEWALLLCWFCRSVLPVGTALPASLLHRAASFLESQGDDVTTPPSPLSVDAAAACAGLSVLMAGMRRRSGTDDRVGVPDDINKAQQRANGANLSGGEQREEGGDQAVAEGRFMAAVAARQPSAAAVSAHHAAAVADALAWAKADVAAALAFAPDGSQAAKRRQEVESGRASTSALALPTAARQLYLATLQTVETSSSPSPLSDESLQAVGLPSSGDEPLWQERPLEDAAYVVLVSLLTSHFVHVVLLRRLVNGLQQLPDNRPPASVTSSMLLDLLRVCASRAGGSSSRNVSPCTDGDIATTARLTRFSGLVPVDVARGHLVPLICTVLQAVHDEEVEGVTTEKTRQPGAEEAGADLRAHVQRADAILNEECHADVA